MPDVHYCPRNDWVLRIVAVFSRCVLCEVYAEEEETSELTLIVIDYFLFFVKYKLKLKEQLSNDRSNS